MKKAFVYGTAVLALSAAPLIAQQPATGARQGSTPGTATGTARPGGQAEPARPGDAAKPADASKPATAAKPADAMKASSADHQFVMEAARGGMAEVELGQLASDKAQSDQVKQFAQRMVQDHGKANDELKTLAQNKSITIPTAVDAKHKATKDRLAKLSGPAFDRAYMQEMLTDHRKDVSDFRKEAQTGKDADVKAWAAKTLPTLEEHLKMAQDASRSSVGTSGTKAPDQNKGASGTRGTTDAPPKSGNTVPGSGSSTPR